MTIRWLLLPCFLVVLAMGKCGQVYVALRIAVWTQHNDNLRSGLNDRETPEADKGRRGRTPHQPSMGRSDSSHSLEGQSQGCSFSAQTGIVLSPDGKTLTMRLYSPENKTAPDQILLLDKEER